MEILGSNLIKNYFMVMVTFINLDLRLVAIKSKWLILFHISIKPYCPTVP